MKYSVVAVLESVPGQRFVFLVAVSVTRLGGSPALVARHYYDND